MIKTKISIMQLKFQLLFTLAFALICSSVFGQINTIKNQTKGEGIPPHRTCATTELLERNLSNSPELRNQRAQLEEFTKQYLADNPDARSGNPVITIPVVVHVVYRTNQMNVSDAQIQSQLDVLNADYRRTNSDASQTPSSFLGVAADTGIEFCLATQDPNGAPTTGIIRTSTTISDAGSPFNPQIKTISSAWPRASYMNMWVGEIGNFILGYATPPGGASQAEDGIVIDYRYFGTMGTAQAPFNLGRTGTHEVGHWLNLIHIWGDGGCSVDDAVADTPAADSANYGCSASSSCGSTDMKENYMDYSDDACMNLFTQGQATRMQAALNSSVSQRNQLQNSNGCASAGPAAPNAAFNASSQLVCSGESVSFTDNSSQDPTSWMWDFGDGNTSTMQNPTHTYAAAGTYTVTLVASNSTGSSTNSPNLTIEVGSSFVLNNLPATATPTSFQSNNGGYVAGHNGYSDIGKADYFSTVSSGDIINEITLCFAAANASNASSTFEVKLWSDSGSGPGSVLHTENVTYADADADVTAGECTTITLSAPYTATGPVYAGITFAYSGTDTIALVTTNDGEGPNSAWEQWNDNNWYAYDSGSSWGLSLTHFIELGILCEAPTGAAPVADFSTSSTSACAPAEFFFSDSSTENPTSWLWDFGDGTTSTMQNPTHTYANGGTYTVTLTATNANGSNMTSSSITVNAAPAITFNSLPSTTSSATPLALTATPSGGTFDGPGVTFAAFNPQIAGPGNHTITYTYDDGTGCIGTATDNILVVNISYNFVNYQLGVISPKFVDDIESLDQSLDVYPNPASDQIQISFDNPEQGAVQFEIYDMNGNLIQQRLIDQKESFIQISENISDLRKGIYLISIGNGKDRIQRKLLKE